MKFKNVLYPIFLTTTLSISIASLSQVPADSTAADSALLKQVEQQMQANTQPAQQPQQTRSSLTFNPDIGVIGDFQGSYISKGNKNFNAYLNETELSLQATVDPYARADFFVSFARNPVTGQYGDRKSTRLNSSHPSISYAVFCL